MFFVDCVVAAIRVDLLICYDLENHGDVSLSPVTGTVSVPLEFQFVE